MLYMSNGSEDTLICGLGDWVARSKHHFTFPPAYLVMSTHIECDLSPSHFVAGTDLEQSNPPASAS